MQRYYYNRMLTTLLLPTLNVKTITIYFWNSYFTTYRCLIINPLGRYYRYENQTTFFWFSPIPRENSFSQNNNRNVRNDINYKWWCVLFTTDYIILYLREIIYYYYYFTTPLKFTSLNKICSPRIITVDGHVILTYK